MGVIRAAKCGDFMRKLSRHRDDTKARANRAMA